MQTFAPLTDYRKIALCLHRLHLGKQRVEVFQILRTLCGLSDGWKNHPAVRMWRGYEYALFQYGMDMIREWKRRGYKDTLWLRMRALLKFDMPKHYGAGNPFNDLLVIPRPPWWGDERVHSSHRANLLRKMPEHYGRFGWTEEPCEGYFWPVCDTEETGNGVV